MNSHGNRTGMFVVVVVDDYLWKASCGSCFDRFAGVLVSPL